jgi:hypothetical protein
VATSVLLRFHLQKLTHNIMHTLTYICSPAAACMLRILNINVYVSYACSWDHTTYNVHPNTVILVVQAIRRRRNALGVRVPMATESK